MDDKLKIVKRYFSNRYSKNDYLELKKLILEQKPELENLMTNHWEDFQIDGRINHKDLSSIHATIDHQLKVELKKQSVKRLLHYYSRIASMLLIPLLLALGILYFQFDQYLFQKDVYVDVSSPAGSRTRLNLPDGSTVWLNGDSHIRYPAVFKKERKVCIDGEAFFKVKSDKEHPFLVSANNINVKATGTEFNVLAYNDDSEIDVILKEGQIAVLDENFSEIKKVDAGYQLKINKTDYRVQYAEINAIDYTGWVDGRLIFRNATMDEIISRMERWYGVKIEVKDPELLNLHFKATFINESIEEAFKLLQSTATFRYQFVKRQNNEDGSYKNVKIYITKN